MIQKLFDVCKPFAIRATKKGVWCWLVWTLAMLLCQLLSLLDGLAWLMWAVHGLQAIAVVLVGVFLYEYVWLMIASRSMPDIQIKRLLDKNLPVYETSKVTLQIHHHHIPKSGKRLRLVLMDENPPQTQAQGLPAHFFAHALTKYDDDKPLGVFVEYELYASERGKGVFGGVDWLIETPLGLLTKFYHTPQSSIMGVDKVRILANFKAVVQGNLLAMHKNAGGIIKRKRKGQGQDFHQIRSYSEGDSIRRIDWKATARHQRLMSKEYQDEADQEIMFLLDCGQRMRHIRFADDAQLPQMSHTSSDQASPAKSSHLDMALNAMLLLAQVANQQADATGFISFGATVDKSVPPKKGSQVISYLLNQSFDLKASMNAPDYMAVARRVLSMQRRRSLLVMITNLSGDSTTEIGAALQLLTQKHRVILVNLYESDLKDYLQNIPQTVDEALTYQSVYAYLHGQKQLNIRLGEETGAMVVGSTPQELPSKLLDSYWMARRWGVA